MDGMKVGFKLQLLYITSLVASVALYYLIGGFHMMLKEKVNGSMFSCSSSFSLIQK